MIFHLSPSLVMSRSTTHNVRWCIGIDGGGTTTRATVADVSGAVLGEGTAGASALNQGAQQAWKHIVEAIDRAGVTGLRIEESALGIGLSGTDVQEHRQSFVQHAPRVARYDLISDGLAGVLGAHGGRPGALLISGTGSVGEALLADGTRLMTGGWGWQTGDEGSGAWLGKKAISLAQAALDGRAPRGLLALGVFEEVGSRRADLLSFCARAGQGEYAQLARLVFERQHVDLAAAILLDEATHALEALANPLPAELPLALAGGIALRLQNRLSPALRARLVKAEGDAAVGALGLALRSTGAVGGYLPTRSA